MESDGELRALERLLRSLVLDTVGPDWRAALNSREQSEAERSRTRDLARRGVANARDLIDYTTLANLKKIIDAKWRELGPALPPKERFDVYIDRILAFRNTDSHGRDLLPHEEHLVVGIAGDIRTSIAIYRSQQGPDMSYYPTVESITDSLGSDLYPNPQGYLTGKRLAVGDEVFFRCRATDPQGRTLRWVLEFVRSDLRLILSSVQGEYVELSWVVGRSQVWETVSVHITLTSSGEFHRDGAYDFQRALIYAVDPPLDSEG